MVRSLKEGKAGGGDGISNEVWKYGGGRGGGMAVGYMYKGGEGGRLS